MNMTTGRAGWASASMLLASVVLSGCCAAGMKDSRVSISPEIDGDIKLRGLTAGRGQGGTTVVEAEIGNCERHVEQYQYRVTWLDEQGLAIDTPSSVWSTETLAPKSVERLRLVAPVASAEDFRLELIDVEDEDRLLWWPFDFFFGRR